MLNIPDNTKGLQMRRVLGLLGCLSLGSPGTMPVCWVPCMHLPVETEPTPHLEVRNPNNRGLVKGVLLVGRQRGKQFLGSPGGRLSLDQTCLVKPKDLAYF